MTEKNWHQAEGSRWLEKEKEEREGKEKKKKKKRKERKKEKKRKKNDGLMFFLWACGFFWLGFGNGFWLISFEFRLGLGIFGPSKK